VTRSLTPAEATVLRSLVAAADGEEAERLQRTGVPRRTYQEIRRRAFAEGWLSRRFVPNGGELGLPYLTFTVAKPFAERSREVAAAWVADPYLTTLWRSKEVLFGVFLGPKPRAAESGLELQFILNLDVRAPSVPVYFDFEGFWSQWTGLLPTLSYPRAVPGVGVRSIASTDPASTARWRSAVRELNQSWSVASPGGRPPRGEAPLPRRLRKLAQSGRVQSRVFPDLQRIPPPVGRPIKALCLCHLRLQRGKRPEQLFRGLILRGVYPFLYGTDGGYVLMGTVLRSDLLDLDGAQLESATAFGEEIGISRMPLDELEVVLSHRYGHSPGSRPV
jgi:hypothetical protein